MLADDTDRVEFYDGYLNAMKKAIVEDGVDVRSYFAWSYVFFRPLSGSEHSR